MGDLSDIQASLSMKLAGADALTGIETYWAFVDQYGTQAVVIRDTAGNALIGQKTMAGSLPVVIASDQTPVQVVGNVASAASDSGNPIKIGGRFNTTLPTLTSGQRGDLQLDSSARVIIAPLTNTSIIKAQLQDNAGNGLTSTLIGAKQALDVNATVSVGFVPNTAGVNGAITVGTSAVEAKVGASALASRLNLTVFHNGSGKLYWGYSNAVTAANGTQIFKNTTTSIDAGPNLHVWLISDTAGQDVRVTEAS
jgi:hypothetical protein